MFEHLLPLLFQLVLAVSHARTQQHRIHCDCYCALHSASNESSAHMVLSYADVVIVLKILYALNIEVVARIT